MSPAVYKQYTQEMHDRFGYLATWLPNVGITLGDVGILRRDRFERVTTLQKLGIAWEPRVLGGEINIEYSSKGSTDIQVDLGSDSDNEAKCQKLTISFKRENATIFVAQGCTTRNIEDLKQMEDEVRARLKNGVWDPRYSVITELVTAKSGTILVSNSSNARIDLTASLGTTTLFQLADPTNQVRLNRASGIAVQVVAATGLTPLFRAAGLKTRLFGKPIFEVRSNTESVEELMFSQIGYEDLDPEF